MIYGLHSSSLSALCVVCQCWFDAHFVSYRRDVGYQNSFSGVFDATNIRASQHGSSNRTQQQRPPGLSARAISVRPARVKLPLRFVAFCTDGSTASWPLSSRMPKPSRGSVTAVSLCHAVLLSYSFVFSCPVGLFPYMYRSRRQFCGEHLHPLLHRSGDLSCTDILPTLPLHHISHTTATSSTLKCHLTRPLFPSIHLHFHRMR